MVLETGVGNPSGSRQGSRHQQEVGRGNAESFEVAFCSFQTLCLGPWTGLVRQRLHTTSTTMPTTKTVTAYTFDELGEQAKDKAREWMRKCALNYEWWDSTYEDAAQAGIKIEGFDLGRAQSIDGKVDQPETTAHYITKNHGEQCETYKTAAAYLSDRDTLLTQWPRDENNEFENEDELDAKLDELDEEFTKSILEDYRIILEKEHDYRLSDETIDEDIRANDYLFTEKGRRTVAL